MSGYFCPKCGEELSTVYLSTVGYGTGALLGRGVERVEAVHWHEELGLAQAMWIIRGGLALTFVAVAIDLTVKERKTLQQYVRSRTTPVRLVERSKIILLG